MSTSQQKKIAQSLSGFIVVVTKLTVPPATRSSASSARPVRRPMSSSHRTGVLTRGRRDPLLQVFPSRRGRHLRRARPQADGDLYRRGTEARLRSLPVRRYFRSRWNRSRTRARPGRRRSVGQFIVILQYRDLYCSGGATRLVFRQAISGARTSRECSFTGQRITRPLQSSGPVAGTQDIQHRG